MLIINGKQISIEKLTSRKPTDNFILDDCFSFEEKFINCLDISWSEENGIDRIEIQLPFRGNPDGPTSEISVTLEDHKHYFHNLPQNYVAIFQLKLKIEGKEYIHNIEIKPRKIDEKTYFRLLNDLRERNISIYSRISQAHTLIGTVRSKPFSSLMERFKAMVKDMDELKLVVERISECPRKKLKRVICREPIYLAYDADDDTIHDACTMGGGLVRNKYGAIHPALKNMFTGKNGEYFLPETVLLSNTEIDYNVFENMLLKRFLKLVALNMKSLEKHFKHEIELAEKGPLREDLVSCIQKCRAMRRDALNMLNLPFLSDVDEIQELTRTSLALRQDIQYMRFHAIYKKFLNKPYYDRSKIYEIPIDVLWQLYEYWCCAVVYDTLLMFQEKGWRVASQSFIKDDELGFETTIHKNTPLLVMEMNNERIELTFQNAIQSFIQRQTWETHKEPDIVIRYFEDNKFANMMILDAKYRDKLFQEVTENSARSAVNDMHVYRDAFRNEKGIRLCGWAVILYPGKKPDGSSMDFTYEWRDNADNTSGVMPFCLRPIDDFVEQQAKLFNMFEERLFNRDVNEIERRLYS